MSTGDENASLQKLLRALSWLASPERVPDPSLSPAQRLYEATKQRDDGDGFWEPEFDRICGFEGDWVDHKLVLQATVLRGLGELLRLWDESGADGPFPVIDDLSAPVSKEYVYDIVANREGRPRAREVDANVSRWFREKVENGGVWWFRVSRERVVVNVRQLVVAFDLEPEDARDLRHPVR